MHHEKFKVICGPRKAREESGEIIGPQAFSMARGLAESWVKARKRHIQLLRADTSGINADKFFLYQIINS